ncbi:hypothetical protein EGT07_17655 [Herbaspirillum sp. HC18]|nr:hypothetical protein EGT07_17655 [Herbaspirillum sp. HC18]
MRGIHQCRKAIASLVCVFGFFIFAGAAQAQSRNVAPNFQSLPKGAKVVVMPVDVELFSISAGGVLEPKADWTEAATRHFTDALTEKKNSLGLASVELKSADADELSEVNALHAAVARSIALHHFGPSSLYLPTKDGKLDWSLGEAVAPIRQKTGADFALFSWVRDSYASAERKAAMVAMALLGVGLGGGAQIGYASLVDLNTGRVLWFNQLRRGTGDLREADKAKETVGALLEVFPIAR